MQKLYVAAIVYAVLGLAAGLFYREYTVAQDFTGSTQLAVAHTHLLALGFMVMLIVLALDAVLKISGTRSFSWFFATYNAGLLIAVGVMVWHGMLQVQGQTDVSAAIPGIAGVGHILLTVGLVSLLVSLRRPVRRAVERR
ncbi:MULTISPECIES: DUF2871 domain-containing protein [unclassified Isoptericola]|uniref:DUF2871 domain-containing protein n=1 Tax=unclassified Isoptericola TaxID=2623355 RepID=UPI0036691879